MVHHGSFNLLMQSLHRLTYNGLNIRKTKILVEKGTNSWQLREKFSKNKDSGDYKFIPYFMMAHKPKNHNNVIYFGKGWLFLNIH